MMKPFLPLLVLLSLNASAQSFIPENNQAPVKLQDVIDAHKREEQFILRNERKEERDERGKHVAEERSYHFDRWAWYWRQHTDADGYMVSPVKTWREWHKYFGNGGKEKTTATNNANWTFLGPSSSQSGYYGIGRINTMEFHPTNANTYWVGTAGGGVWKTTNNGAAWTCLTDKLPVLSVSDVDVNQKNPNTIYLCTGDRDSRDHYSHGVLKSYDGGQTWDTTGLKWDPSSLQLTNCLLINPKDTNSLILAASNGIYRSFNGGQSWTSVKSGNFKQVLYHPTDTNIVYATSFYVKAVGVDAQIFRSNNGGNTWTQVTNLSKSWRITLAVTPDDVKIVKAIVACNDSSKWRGLIGVYNSSDTGKNFTQIFNDNNCTSNILSGDVNGYGCSGQGNYDLALAIDPNNANYVAAGGVNSWYSTSGGSSWTIVNHWYGASGVPDVHADKHFLGYHPSIPGRLFECNDGGIYYITNPLSGNWTDVSNGIGNTQFYRNAVTDEAEFVLAGAQDNGTKLLTGGFWDNASGGDGMDCQIDYADTNFAYSGVQYGVIYRLSSGGWPYNVSDNIPGQPQGGWITPYILSPFDHYQVLAGYKMIWWSPDQGDSWYQVSSDSLNYSNFVLRVAMTRASSSTIYAVIENTNKIYYTHNFSPSSVMALNTIAFDSITAPPGIISDITVDPKDKDHFWITYSGFNSTQVQEYKSGNWTQMNANLPNIPVLCIERDSLNGTLYIGTDIGVFYLNDSTGNVWEPYNKNLPALHVCDLGINYKTKEIFASTYGRGLWKSTKQDYVGIYSVPIARNAIGVVPNPSDGKFVVTVSTGQYKSGVAMALIIDNAGRTVFSAPVKLNNGRAEINAEKLPKGNYVVELQNGNLKLGQQKIVIK
jgi:hypothetical protein